MKKFILIMLALLGAYLYWICLPTTTLHDCYVLGTYIGDFIHVCIFYVIPIKLAQKFYRKFKGVPA